MQTTLEYVRELQVVLEQVEDNTQRRRKQHQHNGLHEYGKVFVKHVRAQLH